MGLWYPKDSGFELTAFSDADHAGCLDTRKSTSGGRSFPWWVGWGQLADKVYESLPENGLSILSEDSIDDLYNFKIVKQKVKKSVGASSGAQNLAFMTTPSTSSTNDTNTASPQVSTAIPNVNVASPQVSTASVSDNTVYAFMVENPNGSNVLHQDLEQIHEDYLEAIDLKWQLSLLCVRAKKYYQRTGKNIFINANDIAGNQDNTRKQGNNEAKYSKAMLAIDGVGFDWSDMAEEQVQTNMALMAFSDSEKFDKASKDLDQLLGSQITNKCKKGLGYSAVPPPHPLIYNRPNKLDMSYSGLDEFKEPEFKESLVEEQVSQDTSSFVESSPKVDKETFFPVNKKVEFTKPKNHEKPVKKSVRHVKRGRDTKIPQSSGPLIKVGDEAVHKELSDRIERAATTASSFEATGQWHILMLPVQVTAAEEIIDFLKASSVRYALTVNPIIYTSCIEQFWATTKVQTVNGVRQLQALVDKKRVIVTESSIRRDLHLDDAEAFEEVGEDSGHPTDSTQVPILDQPSTSSKTKKKQSSKKNQRQGICFSEIIPEHEESGTRPYNEHNQWEIAALKKRNQRLEGSKISRPTGFGGRLGGCFWLIRDSRKLVLSRRVESSEDKESLVAPEDASKQGEVLQILMMMLSTTGEAITTASVKDSAAPTTIEEITLAQTLIQIKAAKPKVVTTAARTTTTTRPKAKRVVVQEPSEFRVPQEEQPLISKDKGKGITIPPEVPLKIKDQIALDEQIARDIQAKLDAELIEEQNLQGYKKKKPT
ncbi:hypothetical protein Tco_0115177 [Tanacetum coccineum]